MSTITQDDDDTKALKAKLKPLPQAERLSLLSEEDENRDTKLILAAYEGRTAMVNTIFDALSSEPDRFTLLNKKDDYGNTALILAASRNDFATVKTILDALSDEHKDEALQQTNERGVSASSLAADNGHSKAIQVMLETPSKSEADANAFNAFLLRLERAKNRTTGEALAQLLNETEILKILDYFLIHQDASLTDQLTLKQQTIQIFLDAIAALKPGESYRLAKQITGLPRTVNILRDDNGEFQLIVETKSKLAGGMKSQLKIAEGSFKKGKPAWRIDSEKEIEVFNLVLSPLTQERYEQEVLPEYQISKELASSETVVYQKGERFKKFKEEKGAVEQLSFYATKAEEGTLSDFLKKKQTLSSDQKNILILDFLKGVKSFHDKEYVHHDLKTDNALVYRDDKEGYRLKVSDFGLTRKKDKGAIQYTTPLYLSPEMLYYISANFGGIARQFSPTLGYYYAHHTPQIFPTDSAGNPDDSTLAQQFRTPNTKNDMWAAGLVIFQIQNNGRFPTVRDLEKIQQDPLQNPLLAGLLNPDRSQRIDIDAALQIHHAEVAQTPEQIPPLTFSGPATKAASSSEAPPPKKPPSQANSPADSEDTPSP